MRARAVIAALLLVPGGALAHASEKAVILTLPTGSYIWAAGIAVGLTALVAGFGLGIPRFGSRLLMPTSSKRGLAANAVAW